MNITHTSQEGVDLVSLNGRLVMDKANQIRLQLRTLIEEGEGRLVLDLGGLTFIDSSGFSVLISAYKGIQAREGRLVICAVSPEIMSLMELTRMNEIFEFYPDATAAVAALKQP